MIKTNEEGRKKIEELIKVYVKYAMETEGLDTLEGATKFKNRIKEKFEISEDNTKIEVDEKTLKEVQFLLDLTLKVKGLESFKLVTGVIGDLRKTKEEMIEDEEENSGGTISR